MSTGNIRRRARYTHIAAPAAVLGALAGTFSVSSATAATTARAEELRSSAFGRITAAATAPSDYTVVSGDTVWGISARFGLSTGDVLSWNGLGQTAVIYPGQTLRLTAPEATAAVDAAPVATSSAADPVAYTVVAGDTVYGIAQRYGVTVDAIFAANGLDGSSIIYPGQQISVGGATAASATVASTSTATTSTGTTHTVVAGDTIYGIAVANGLSVDAVLAANGLDGSSIIYPGQTLQLTAASASASSTTTVQTASLDDEQIENARLIIRIGRELGVSDRGIAIALATSMVESWLRNLDYGDRDSLGLFQQRPSTGWGTAEQILDRERSIRAFYGGAQDPNGDDTRGLLDIPGVESLSFNDAAQAVQISAHPDRYGPWEAQAYEWLAVYG